MKPAIVETLMSQFVEEGRELLANVVTSEREAAWQRVVMGRFLLKVRERLPKRGTPTHGWGAFLGAIELDQATADRYMKLADASLDLTERDKDKVPTYADLGLDRRESPQPSEIPPPRDEDRPGWASDGSHDFSAPGTPDRNAEEQRLEPEIDRNTWCTPKDWAERLGSWDLDPCSNERSHIQASRELRKDERGEDGLFFASQFGPETRAFINPPYSRGQVIQWVEAYAHTRFCFLLKFDPSTDWFAALMRHTGVVMIPRGERVEFEPPVGVPPEKAVGVQFPHAFFFAREEDVTAEMRAACFPAWRVR